MRWMHIYNQAYWSITLHDYPAGGHGNEDIDMEIESEGSWSTGSPGLSIVSTVLQMIVNIGHPQSILIDMNTIFKPEYEDEENQHNKRCTLFPCPCNCPDHWVQVVLYTSTHPLIAQTSTRKGAQKRYPIESLQKWLRSYNQPTHQELCIRTGHRFCTFKQGRQ